MFVHVAKDFLQKIEGVEKRLAVSLDRDEIQTLGLKLRFYYNEISHYQSLMGDVMSRIVEVQEKFGFQPEPSGDEPQHKTSAVLIKPPVIHEAPPPRYPAEAEKMPAREEDVVGLVSAWISRLEEDGVDPREVLRSAGATIQEEQHRASAKLHAEEKTAVEKNFHREEEPPREKIERPSAIPKQAGFFAARNAAAQYMKTVVDSDDAGNDEPETPGRMSADKASWNSRKEPPPQSYPAGKIEPDYPQSSTIPDMSELEKSLESARDRLSGSNLIERQKQKPAPEESDYTVSMLHNEDSPIPLSGKELVEEMTATEQSADRNIEQSVMAIKDMFTKSAANQMDAFETLEQLCEKNPADVHEWISGLHGEKEEEFFASDKSGALEFCAGCLAAGIGMTGTAINRLETAFSKGLTNSNGKILLSDLYYIKGIFSKSLKGYREAEESADPSSATAMGIIRSLRELKKTAELVEEVDRRNFNDENERLEALCHKAEALIMLDRTQEATGLLDGLLQTTSKNRWKARLTFLKAGLMEKKGDAVGATDCYESSLELDSDNPEALFALGSLYMQHRAIPLAKGRLSTLVKKFPESPWADQARALMDREGVL